MGSVATSLQDLLADPPATVDLTVSMDAVLVDIPTQVRSPLVSGLGVLGVVLGGALGFTAALLGALELGPAAWEAGVERVGTALTAVGFALLVLLGGFLGTQPAQIALAALTVARHERLSLRAQQLTIRRGARRHAILLSDIESVALQPLRLRLRGGQRVRLAASLGAAEQIWLARLLNALIDAARPATGSRDAIPAALRAVRQRQRQGP